MEYVRPQLEQTRFSGGHEKLSLGPRLGEKAWGEKAGASKIICVLGVKERPKVIASRRISSLLRLCPREVMLLFFSFKRGMKSVHPHL